MFYTVIWKAKCVELHLTNQVVKNFKICQHVTASIHWILFCSFKLVMMSDHIFCDWTCMDVEQGTQPLPGWRKRCLSCLFWRLTLHQIRSCCGNWIPAGGDGDQNRFFYILNACWVWGWRNYPFNLSGFKQEIINWRAVHCRLLKIIITIKL